MKLLKGCAQIKLENDFDNVKIFTYVNDPNHPRLIVLEKDGEYKETWWEKDQIAGKGNPHFTGFHLWFEYE